MSAETNKTISDVSRKVDEASKELSRQFRETWQVVQIDYLNNGNRGLEIGGLNQLLKDYNKLLASEAYEQEMKKCFSMFKSKFSLDYEENVYSMVPDKPLKL